MSIAQQLEKIRSTLPETVTLVAVSKTKPAEAILEAYAAGQRHFGENYIQELQDKYNQLPKDINWHFIGHLQSNKVKYIAPYVHLIHGVDSIKLLNEINKQALNNKRIINCLLQVHISSEETKFGFSTQEVLALPDSADFSQLKNISIQGLMGMASFTEDTVQIEKEFVSLKSLFDQLSQKTDNTPNLVMKEISMGMSSDYELAIKHGSTIIRVGSSIFGSRIYSN